MTETSDETAQAQKVAEATARDYYDYGPDIRVTDTEGPTEIFKLRSQGVTDEVDSRAWVVSVDVPDKGTIKMTVLRTGEGWYCVQTEPPVWKKN